MSRKLPAGSRRLLRIGSVPKDLDEELAFHFEKTIEELMQSGATEQEARAEAARRFGDESSYRREITSIDHAAARTRRVAEKFDALRHMWTQSVRSIFRSPALTTGVVLAFALGIGANAIMFGIIDRLLLRPPLHIAAPDRVSHLYFEQYYDNLRERVAESVISYPDYVDMLKAKSFESVGAESDRELTIGSGESAKRVTADLVTGNFFDMLGTKPALGHFFDPATDKIGGVRETVISYGMWKSDFAGSRDAIGKTIDFGYGPYTIIGVTPKGFTSVGLSRIDLYLPLHVAAAQLQGDTWAPDPDGRNWQWINVFARLAPGVTAERASAEASAIHKAASAETVARGEWGKDPSVIAGSLIVAKGPNAPGALVVTKLLAGVSFLVLLIAAVNVANLLLARTIRQRREIAVRLALGVSRTRLVGQLVMEGVMLALLGGAAALAVEHWGGDLVKRILLPDVAWNDFGSDTRVVWAVAALALLAGIIAAVVPASQLIRRDISDTIRQAGSGGITRTSSGLRTSLALAQTALSVILLVGAGLFVRSLRTVRGLDLGMDVQNVSFAVPRATRDAIGNAERDAMFEAGAERISRIPGVRAVATASTFPFLSRRQLQLRAEGVDSIPRPRTGGLAVHGVSPSYFEAMGLSILRGRGLRATDGDGGQRVAVMNEDMAAYIWPNEDAIGKCLYIGDKTKPQPCTRVVGIVENAVNAQIGDSLAVQYYVPLRQTDMDPDTKQAEPIAGHADFWIIRTAPGIAVPIDAVRKTILALNPGVRFADVTPMKDRIRDETRAWTLGATMFGIFGALALVVAAIGLYSVLAFDIAQRTRELGLRTALGASATQLVRMVVSRAVFITAAGMAIGGTIAVALAPRVKDLLFQVSPHDPLTYVGVTVTLGAVAIAAAAIPGLRATRVDPNIALRAD
jgi:predicted permease